MKQVHVTYLISQPTSVSSQHSRNSRSPEQELDLCTQHPAHTP